MREDEILHSKKKCEMLKSESTNKQVAIELIYAALFGNGIIL
jgi:hypothetical protein